MHIDKLHPASQQMFKSENILYILFISLSSFTSFFSKRISILLTFLNCKKYLFCKMSAKIKFQVQGTQQIIYIGLLNTNPIFKYHFKKQVIFGKIWSFVYKIKIFTNLKFQLHLYNVCCRTNNECGIKITIWWTIFIKKKHFLGT